jgi:hypothetical protein
MKQACLTGARALWVGLSADSVGAFFSLLGGLVDGFLCGLFYSSSRLLGGSTGRFTGVFDIFFCALHIILGGLRENRRHTNHQDGGKGS